MEQIYTIPVNEAFEASASASANEGIHVCPFCRLYRKLESDECELILGASMMEPDTRIRTNEEGFCRKHIGMLFGMGKRLPLALILESHLEHIGGQMKTGIFPAKSGAAAAKRMGSIAGDCYICNRIEYNFSRMIETAALLWQSDPAFRELTATEHHFCLEHFARFLAAAEERLSRREFAEFYTSVGGHEAEYIETLKEDVGRFCKMFDYRYSDEPWEDAKNAPERASAFLVGDEVYD